MYSRFRKNMGYCIVFVHVFVLKVLERALILFTIWVPSLHANCQGERKVEHPVLKV